MNGRSFDLPDRQLNLAWCAAYKEIQIQQQNKLQRLKLHSSADKDFFFQQALSVKEKLKFNGINNVW